MDRWKCLKPEDINPGEWYSFSYNPKDQPMLAPINHRDGFKEPFSQWYKDEISSFFKRLRYSEYELRLEISSGGRFHVHGRIKIKDVILFYAIDLKRMQVKGSYEIDYINDPMEWDLYCRKLSRFMNRFCVDEEIPYIFRTEESNNKLKEFQAELL